jgi:hypothetical protein
MQHSAEIAPGLTPAFAGIGTTREAVALNRADCRILMNASPWIEKT